MRFQRQLVRFGLTLLGFVLTCGGSWLGIDLLVHYRQYAEESVAGGSGQWLAVVAYLTFALVGILLIFGNWRKSDERSPE